MRKLRIYPIIILSILVLSLFLPKIYKSIFNKRVDKSYIYYSPVDKDFVKFTIKRGQNRKVVYSNLTESETFTQDEYKSKLPFFYYRDLLKIDKFPEEFLAFAQDTRAVRSEVGFAKIRPVSINQELVNLYPLFESRPKYSSLEIPKDLFRLDDKGITFIITSTNSIDKKKSNIFNTEFLKQGAVFPLKKAFGNATTRKAFDEGYFITDAKNQLFHLKRVNDEVKINRVETNGIKIKYIEVREHSKKEFYAIAVSEDSKVYLIMYGGYEFVQMPIKEYDYKRKTFRIFTTPINRVLSIEYVDYINKQKVIETIVTNLDYEKQKESTYRYSLKNSIILETIERFVFPFTLKTVSTKESYVTISLRDIHKESFILYFILSILYLLFIKLSKRSIKEHILPAVLIALAGIYSIIILILFNKFLTYSKTYIKGQK